MVQLNTNHFKTDYFTLTGTTAPGQSRPGDNRNEGVLYILQVFRIWASPSDAVEHHTQGHLLFFLFFLKGKQCILSSTNNHKEN